MPSATRICCCCADHVCIWLQALKYLEQLLLYDGKRRMKALDAANVSQWPMDQGVPAAYAKIAVRTVVTLPLAEPEPVGCLGSLHALLTACMWPEAVLRCSKSGMQYHARQQDLLCLRSQNNMVNMQLLWCLQVSWLHDFLLKGVPMFMSSKKQCGSILLLLPAGLLPVRISASLQP